MARGGRIIYFPPMTPRPSRIRHASSAICGRWIWIVTFRLGSATAYTLADLGRSSRRAWHAPCGCNPTSANRPVWSSAVVEAERDRC